MPSKTITKWKLIRLVDCIMESHLTGTTNTYTLTSPCHDTSKSNSKNMNNKGLPQDSPYLVLSKKYGKAAQDPIPEDTTKELSEDKKNRDQQVLGSILYYAQAVNITLLVKLSTIAAEQSKATKNHYGNSQTTSQFMCNAPKCKTQIQNI